MTEVIIFHGSQFALPKSQLKQYSKLFIQTTFLPTKTHIQTSHRNKSLKIFKQISTHNWPCSYVVFCVFSESLSQIVIQLPHCISRDELLLCRSHNWVPTSWSHCAHCNPTWCIFPTRLPRYRSEGWNISPRWRPQSPKTLHILQMLPCGINTKEP